MTMEYRLTTIISEHGRDPANAERVLESFAAAAPETGPVVEVNTTSGTLAITISVEVDDFDAADLARIVIEGLNRSGLPATAILDVELVDVAAGAELQRELTLA
jgi:hypothetical protein